MANKLDLEKPLFVGPTAVREGTVVDAIRKAVSELDTGEGVTYPKLEEHMLRSFTPGKSSNYSASYIKSYVRDGVNKYGHLSHESGHSYSALAAPEKKERTARARRPSKASQERMDMLRFIRDQGQVTDSSQLDNTQISAEDFAAASGRKQKTIDRMLDELQNEGLVRIDSRDGNVEGDVVRYVFLTPAGYAKINEAVPEGAGSDEVTERTESAAELGAETPAEAPANA